MLDELLDTIETRLRQSEQGQAVPNAAIADRVREARDQLAAVFQTLARCSDMLRVIDGVDGFPESTDIVDLADEARQHCKDAGLITEKSMRHTKEPWVYKSGAIVTENGAPIAQMDLETDEIEPAEQYTNANRIVACVNACAGINPEAIPDLLLALELAIKDVFEAYATAVAENKNNLARELGSSGDAYRKALDAAKWKP